MALRTRLNTTALSQSAASVASPNAWMGAATLQRTQRFTGRSPIVMNPLVVATIKNSPTSGTRPITERATTATRQQAHSLLLAGTQAIITPNQHITGQTSTITSTVESTRRNLTARTSYAASQVGTLLLSTMRRFPRVRVPGLS